MATLVTVATGGQPAQFLVKESPSRIQYLLGIAASNRRPAVELSLVRLPGTQPLPRPTPVLVGVRHFVTATAEEQD